MPRSEESVCRRKLCYVALCLIVAIAASGQGGLTLALKRPSLPEICAILKGNGDTIVPDHPIPLVSWEVCAINDLTHKKTFFSSNQSGQQNESIGIQVSVEPENGYKPGYKAVLTFKNCSPDTIWLTNVVPLGFSENKVCITGKGDHPLSRSYLFRSGYEPVNCITVSFCSGFHQVLKGTVRLVSVV
jgi:hypothetical protein